MMKNKIKVELYLGEPLLFDHNLSVNDILLKCANNRNISVNSMKGFMLTQDGYYFIPADQPVKIDSDEPIYYRYVDYHTDRDSLYYIDNPCFHYIFHQYKYDVRQINFSNETGILTELCAMEILIMAMVFGDAQMQKPHKFIKYYKELCDNPLIDTDSKDVKMALIKGLKDLKDVRTEYECMEKYIQTVDKNIKEVIRCNKTVFNVSIDIMKQIGIRTGSINIFKEKIEILEDSTGKNCIINPVKQQRHAMHTIEFSDPKLYIKAFEIDLKLDILTQHGRYGLTFCNGPSSSKDESKILSKQWRKCVALVFFYANLEFPRSRKEPCPAEIVGEDRRSLCLHVESCPLIVPAPPIHYKLTRQDVRMILKRYGTQDGWYMFNTFDMAPKQDEYQTNGELSLSYCMDDQIHQMSVTFCQEIGFGPPIYRVDYFRGRKFCSLYELASHFSIDGRRLHTFVTEKMIKEVAIPGSVFFPAKCIKMIKSIDEFESLGVFYCPLDNQKHTVRCEELPKNFWHGNANTRVSEIESMIRSLCDTNSIHQNLVRLFGICMDNQNVHVSQITEDFGVCLHDFIKHEDVSDHDTLLKIAYQVASGIQGLHSRQIIHGFPVLHNCLIDPGTKQVKLGGVGILRIGITTQRLDGNKLIGEQPSFKCETVPGETRFHPSRWLPKESLYDHHFNELTDRWCFGIVLWQIFSKAEIPLSNYSDSELVEQLKLEKENWYSENLVVDVDNKFLQIMLETTINYCLNITCVDSIEKVVRLLDIEEGQVERRENSANYTFADLHQEPCDLEDLEIEEIDGLLCFRSPDYACNMTAFQSNYKGISDVNDLHLHDSSCDSDSDKEDEEARDARLQQELNNLNLNICAEDESDVIESIQTLDDSDVELSDVIIGQGNFASVWKGVLRTEGIEVAVKLYHPDIKAVDIQKEIDAMTQLKHDFIIPLRGVYKGDGTTWLIMTFYKFGSLDKYIEQNTTITVERLCLFAKQIAEGMQFLSNMNYIHRDLSTRNVLVQNHQKVRISDLGLSRSVENQYYIHKTGVIPYLWYPPEFFDTHTYGKSLDVWSYGITCCEIFNNAEVPYLNCEPPITDIKMLKEFFDNGNRLSIPCKTPTIFNTIIKNCWKEKAERWTFNDIVDFIYKYTTNK